MWLPTWKHPPTQQRPMCYLGDRVLESIHVESTECPDVALHMFEYRNEVMVEINSDGPDGWKTVMLSRDEMVVVRNYLTKMIEKFEGDGE